MSGSSSIESGRRFTLSRRGGFKHFLDRVHRRYVVLRVMERGGLGLLVGCAAALPLLLILLLHRQPSANVALAAMTLGLAGGLVWGAMTRPTRLAAALESDRQLDWADLMSSALELEDRGDEDPWARAVIAAADQRCHQAAPSVVILNRLGARAWGGIGLAALLVAVLAFVPMYVVPSNAAEATSGAASIPPEFARTGEPPSFYGPRPVSRTRADAQPQDTHATNTAITQPPDSQHVQNTLPPQGQDQPRNSDSRSDGSGTGASHSRVSQAGQLKPIEDGTNARQQSPGREISGGAGLPADSAAGHAQNAGQSSGARDEAQFVPPWQSSDWPRDVRQAHEALGSGRVPDTYRDVLREYFDRRDGR